MLREDIRGICHRPCIYNDKGKCDMWDELSVPDGGADSWVPSSNDVFSEDWEIVE